MSNKTKETFEKAKVTITYWFKDNRRRDPDNYCGKLIMDGLTKAGVIVDDDFDHVTLMVRKGGVDKKNPRTEIEVKEDEEWQKKK